MNNTLPTVLCIAGSDSGAGAGIQADLKTISAMGGYGFCAISALTAQNSKGIHHIALTDLNSLDAQIDAVLSDYPIGAVKIGMLGSEGAIELVAKKLNRIDVPVVIDPVLVSTSGTPLLDNSAIGALTGQLFPKALLITPNSNEASYLTGLEVRSAADVEAAGQKLLELGCSTVLIKGGHLSEAEATDYLITVQSTRPFNAPREAKHCRMSLGEGSSNTCADEPRYFRNRLAQVRGDG